MGLYQEKWLEAGRAGQGRCHPQLPLVSGVGLGGQWSSEMGGGAFEEGGVRPLPLGTDVGVCV